MKRAEFIQTLSETLGVEGKTVNIIARVLREAGYMTTGSRGVNAPDMTPRDAAAVSLALMTGEGPTKVLEKFQRFSSCTMDNRYSDEKSDLLSLLGANDNSSLLDVMELAFAAFTDEAIFDPFILDMAGTKMLPPFSFTLIDNTANVSFRDGCGSTIIFDDMAESCRFEERFRLKEAARNDGDWELYSKLLHEDEADSPLLDGSHKGMRVTREITVVEFQKIGSALFNRKAKANA